MNGRPCRKCGSAATVTGSSKIGRFIHALKSAGSIQRRSTVCSCLLLLLVFLFGPGVARAAGLVADVAASEQQGYGRVVITFKDRNLLPAYDARVSSGVLKISFEAPVRLSVAAVPNALPNFLTVARHDPDGTAIRFALSKEVKVNTMEAGEKLFIDILPANWQGMPPSLPDDVVRALARRAEEALRKARAFEQAQLEDLEGPEVSLRVGSHPTFTRMVFDWNVEFDTRFAREEDVVRLSFNHPVELNLDDFKARLPEGVNDAAAYEENGRLKFLMRIQPNLNVRAFREDNTYVMDLSMPGQKKRAPEQETIVRALGGAKSAKRTGVIDAPGRVTREKPPADAPAAISVMPEPVSVKPPIRIGAVAPDIAKPKTPHDANKAPSGEPVGETVGNATLSARAPEREKTKTGVQPLNPELASDGQGQDTRRFVPTAARKIGDTIRVEFPFLTPVAAAVFKRANSLWLVFDTDAPIDLRSMRAALKETADNVQHRTYGSWQLIRIDLSANVLTTLGADGSKWIVSIGDMILEPSKPLAIDRNVRNDGSTVLRIPFGEASAIHQIDDRRVGDKIVVVTGFAPARGLLKPQRFAEVRSFVSSQGIAVTPLTDDLRIYSLGDDIIIEREGGLALSNNASIGAPEERIYDPSAPDFVEMTEILTGDQFDYRLQLDELMRELAMAPPEGRKRARTALARFYLANRMSAEAIAVLRNLAEKSPEVIGDATYNIMMGASQVLAGRPQEGLKHLLDSELEDSADAAVWRTIAEVDIGDWRQARQSLPRARAVIGNYPRDLQTEFNLAAAKVMVVVNDFGTATELLSEIDPAEVSDIQASKYDLLRGQLADSSGRSEEALAVFDFVAASDDRPRAAEARYRALRIRYRDGLINAEDLTKELEGLTTSWRGDEIELRALRFLAHVNTDQGDYRKAFEAMKSAVEANPDAETTRLIQEEMNSTFASLFLEGKADELSPVEALALFYDYRILTPVGRRGDEMVRRMADRLISLDLLHQAAELLEHQVEHRLRGAAKAQIAADLAIVYLMDGKPDLALRVLSRTRQAQLPRALERQRRIVEARALTDAGSPELALQLVRNLRGSDVDRLRSNTYWQAERWREAGEGLEAMLGMRWADKMELDKQERIDVLRAAISYSLAEEELALERLRTKFGPKMSDSPNAAAFDIVTSPIETHGVEFLSVAQQIADIDSMQAFLDEYRRHYLSTGIMPREPGEAPPQALAPTGNSNG